ncbi:hypothetical protein [Chryseosolibacter indicus]|uniref:Uncharacterized protein n=1 Tax=Chryseosolibacter indicus TaxID=2782351 RepID=A0ABS5VRR6_9BACT|nr:hypothetical protein [Chryseosolibacter indicus]MBT1704118.1 hypothetical protein [Chryseosolibacter indicus]
MIILLIDVFLNALLYHAKAEYRIVFVVLITAVIIAGAVITIINNAAYVRSFT